MPEKDPSERRPDGERPETTYQPGQELPGDRPDKAGIGGPVPDPEPDPEEDVAARIEFEPVVDVHRRRGEHWTTIELGWYEQLEGRLPADAHVKAMGFLPEKGTYAIDITRRGSAGWSGDALRSLFGGDVRGFSSHRFKGFE